MNTQHVTIDAIEQWRRGTLAPSEIVSLARHLASCNECAGLASPSNVDRDAHAIRVQIEEPLHPDLETELFGYVDGKLDEDEYTLVAAHLQTCDRCREDVYDAVAARDQSRRALRASSRLWRVVTLAAAVAVALGATMLFQTQLELDDRPPARPRVTTAPKIPAHLDAATESRRALVEAPLSMPKPLRALLTGEEILRSPSGDRKHLSPVGTVVETQRPRLDWDAPNDATSMVVIFAGESEIVRSAPLRETFWIPITDLRRGVTYTWEVQIHSSGGLQIVPSPPAPFARFHVLDTRSAAALEEARRHHRDDPLLLGVLYAQIGLEAQARAELARVRGLDAAIAMQRLLELDAWHR